MIYVDNNATTKVAPEVLEAILPFLQDSYGNPSSLYRFAQQVREALEASRECVALLVGAGRPDEITFTSGGTEANNLALKGLMRARPKRKKIVTSSVEHSSVLETLRALESQGFDVCYLSVDAQGALDLEQFENELDSQTALVSIMHANNETGAVFPIEKIGNLTRRVGAYLHVDAVQSAGKLPINVRQQQIDFLSVSAHKIHGPKGCGALYTRKGLPLAPEILGGSQENKRRAGTENVVGIVGMGRACELATEGLDARSNGIGKLRDHLQAAILAKVPLTQVNALKSERVANTLNVSFEGVDSESILLALDAEGICASSGSACSTGSTQLSHVLIAMGLPEDRVRSALRLSLSRYTTASEIEALIDIIPKTVERIRQIQLLDA